MSVHGHTLVHTHTLCNLTFPSTRGGILNESSLECVLTHRTILTKGGSAKVCCGFHMPDKVGYPVLMITCHHCRKHRLY